MPKILAKKVYTDYLSMCGQHVLYKLVTEEVAMIYLVSSVETAWGIKANTGNGGHLEHI